MRDEAWRGNRATIGVGSVQIGAGGMGEGYRARGPRLDRDVAIEVIPGWMAPDETCVRRLEHEARAAGE